MLELTGKEMAILSDAHAEICEELIDERKGVPQTRYIIEVKEGDVYFSENTEDMKPVPSHLVGYWMQYFETDNRYESARDILKAGNDRWVKCKPVQVVVDSWEEI